MIEPPQPGFTGVVWSARPPQRLARDLTTGPGAVPMAEAVTAWSRLAASFAAAVVEYEKVLADMRGAWQSRRSNEVMDRVTLLRDWLVEAAAAASANAVRFQAQVAAYEIARLAMPDSADIETIQQVQQALESMGGMLGAPIRAVAAQTDADADVAKAIAARVMENYEKATEPLAQPWRQQEPPAVAPDKALMAERSAATTDAPKSAPALPATLPVAAVPMTGRMPRVPTAYYTPVYAQSATASEVVPRATPVPTTAPAAHAAPIAPGAMSSVGAAQDSSRFPRASLPGDAGDQIGFDGEIQAAPAVLGSAEPQAAPVTKPESGGAA